MSYYLKAAYEAWEYQCQLRFDTLKTNEEELNRIFIDIYGLQDELDLDDGVKVNYRNVQTGRDGKFYEVLADSKNIMGKK